MEAKLRGSSKAFREISFIAMAWLRDIHHSLQQQEIRLEQVEQDARNQERGANANTATLVACRSTRNYMERGWKG